MRTIFLDENQTIYRLFSENRLVPRNGISNKDWNYNVEKVSEKALSACYNIWKRRYPQDIMDNVHAETFIYTIGEIEKFFIDILPTTEAGGF